MTIAERGFKHLKNLYGTQDVPSQELARRLRSRVALSDEVITTVPADAIVNAANNSLLGGGGVDGAIHKAAGPELLEACSHLNGCEDGQAKITPGFRLPAKFVIHTVGPQNQDPSVLRSCYRESLRVLEENGLKSIAFPCVGTGVYGFDKEDAANIAIGTVRQYLEKGSNIEKVTFCLFSDIDRKIYKELLPVYFPE